MNGGASGQEIGRRSGCQWSGDRPEVRVQDRKSPSGANALSQQAPLGVRKAPRTDKGLQQGQVREVR